MHFLWVASPRVDRASAFTITMYEYRATIETLWDSVKEFTKAHPEYVAKDNAMGYMSDNHGESYNLCHCKSPLLW